MRSYPFTSQVTYDEQGLPLYDRAVDSKFLRKVFARYFSDGVFYKPTSALQVVADSGMQVKVNPGCCHIQGAIGIEDAQRTLVVQAAEALDRIDTAVARLDLSVAVRSIDLYVVKGVAAESPQPPALTRDSTTWELGLANLFIAKNTQTISQQRITDTRLDKDRCGVVAQTIGDLDTAPYFAQLAAAIAQHQTDAEAQISALQAAIEAVEGDSAWMMTELYDPDALHEDLGVQLYTHSKSGTVHNFVGSGMNGRAKITAAFNDGDTVQLNGTPVTATCGADPVDGDTIVVDKWVTFVADEEGGQINFKGGGGLSNTKLEKATAQADEVFHGKTYYAGDKSLKTGTMAIDTATAGSADVVAGKTFYAGSKTAKTGTMQDMPKFPETIKGVSRNDNNNKVGVQVTPGAYRATDSSGYVSITGVSTLFSDVVHVEKINIWKEALAYIGGKLSHTFSLSKGEVAVFVVHAACMDNNAPSVSISTPNCTTLMDYTSGIYTQDPVYMQNTLLVRVVWATKNTTISATAAGAGDRAVGFMAGWRLIHD